MSYEPSHRRPPRQERWPDATPQEGWRAYPRGGAEHQGWVTAGYQRQPGYPGYPGTADSFDGNGWSRDAFAGSATSGPPLIAPDTAAALGGSGWWLPDRSDGSGRPAKRRGLIAGAVTGLLAAAVAVGASTLAAAFVRPQASPVTAAGGAFIDRTPPALKNFAVEHFGKNDKTVLLIGMYITLAFIAVAIGCLARHEVTIGVAGIAAFGLLGAFVAITRPESHLTDVIPSVIGAMAGIAAFVWLYRAAAPAPLRHAYGSGRKPR